MLMKKKLAYLAYLANLACLAFSTTVFLTTNSRSMASTGTPSIIYIMYARKDR